MKIETCLLLGNIDIASVDRRYDLHFLLPMKPEFVGKFCLSLNTSFSFPLKKKKDLVVNDYMCRQRWWDFI